ncbi:MAG: hypothetical protein JNM70_23905 [Anaerolineae bacterium]|nr:hypothetical protein [Anaerolineae bacterium]
MQQPERKSRPDWLETDGEIRESAPDAGLTGVLDDLRAKKGTGTFRPRFPELHFSTALFIDDAIKTLVDQAVRARSIMPDGLLIECETSRQDSDRARFRLSGRRAGHQIAQLIGTFQRWEGDRTRIDGDFKLYPITEAKQGNSAGVITGLAVLVLMFAGILSLLRSGTFPAELMIAMVMIGVIGNTISSYMQRTERDQRRLKHALNAQESHDLNLLVDILVAAYRDHDVQWIKPPQ